MPFAEVDLCSNTDGGLFLRARLNVSLPGSEHEIAQALVDAAHQTCPYSKPPGFILRAIVSALGSDFRRRYKRPGITIRVSNECFGAKIIFPWLLDNPVTRFAGFFNCRGSVTDLEMGIHAQPELFPLPASFFPIPAAVPEEHADVIRFQHDEPVAFGFEAKTKEVAVERDRGT